MHKTIVMIAALAIAAIATPGCCKQDTIADVGEEIAEASDIAKLQFARCRDKDIATACEDVVRKLDAIEKLALELHGQARGNRSAPATPSAEPAPEAVTAPPGARLTE